MGSGATGRVRKGVGEAVRTTSTAGQHSRGRLENHRGGRWNQMRVGFGEMDREPAQSRAVCFRRTIPFPPIPGLSFIETPASPDRGFYSE